MKILAISDVASKALWCPQCRERLEGVDLILSCGDLPRAYLEFLTNFTPVPILYVHGNHDKEYAAQEPGGCICVDDGGLCLAGGCGWSAWGGSMRYNRESPYQYTEAAMRRRSRQAAAQGAAAGRGGPAAGPTPPARGLNDGEDLPHRGFECFNAFLDEWQPRWFVHGHIHLFYDYKLPRVCQRGETTRHQRHRTLHLRDAGPGIPSRPKSSSSWSRSPRCFPGDALRQTLPKQSNMPFRCPFRNSRRGYCFGRNGRERSRRQKPPSVRTGALVIYSRI